MTLFHLNFILNFIISHFVRIYYIYTVCLIPLPLDHWTFNFWFWTPLMLYFILNAFPVLFVFLFIPLPLVQLGAKTSHGSNLGNEKSPSLSFPSWSGLFHNSSLQVHLIFLLVWLPPFLIYCLSHFILLLLPLVYTLINNHIIN